jgi:hypothetical protein
MTHVIRFIEETTYEEDGQIWASQLWSASNRAIDIIDRNTDGGTLIYITEHEDHGRVIFVGEYHQENIHDWLTDGLDAAGIEYGTFRTERR